MKQRFCLSMMLAVLFLISVGSMAFAQEGASVVQKKGVEAEFQTPESVWRYFIDAVIRSDFDAARRAVFPESLENACGKKVLADECWKKTLPELSEMQFLYSMSNNVIRTRLVK